MWHTEILGIVFEDDNYTFFGKFYKKIQLNDSFVIYHMQAFSSQLFDCWTQSVFYSAYGTTTEVYTSVIKPYICAHL